MNRKEFEERYLGKEIIIPFKPTSWFGNHEKNWEYPLVGLSFPAKGLVVGTRESTYFAGIFGIGVDIAGIIYGFSSETLLPLARDASPCRFVIEGEPHNIQSIFKDLEKIGYRGANTYQDRCTWRKINTNWGPGNHLKSKEEYKELFISTMLHTGTTYEGDMIFQLPEDYSKALQYAKDALENEYWNSHKTPISFGKYDARYEPDKVTFGCTSFSRNQVSAIKEYLQEITQEKLEVILKNI